MTRRMGGLAGMAAAAFALGMAADAHAADRKDIVVAVNELARGLDPGENTGNVDVRAYYSIFDTLIRRDFASTADGDGSKLVPGLAESWSWTSPTTLELKLRRGVTCHDGSPFNAEDVLATFSADRLWGEKPYYAGGRSYFGGLRAVDKVDDFTVKMTVAEHDSALDQRLASYMAFIICDEAWNKFKKDGVEPKVWMAEASKALMWNPVGTGPFRAVDYQKNDRIKLAAFDAYWGGAPNAASVTFRSVPEVAARVAGLIGGDYDIIVDIPPDQWDALKSYPDVVLKTRPLENSHLLVFNMSDPVMADKNLRHALSLAIDRKALIDALWKGQTYTPNGHQLPSYGDVYLKDRKGYAYDQDAAKKALAQSGYKGQELVYRLIPNYYTYNVEAAQVLQEMWREIGINVRIDFVESFTEVRKPGVQIYPWSNTYRIPDPTGALTVNWGPTTDTQRTNKHFVAPPKFNELAAALFSVTDPQERRKDFGEILDLFEDAMPMTMLYNPVAGYAMKKSVDWQPYTQFYMDFRANNLKLAGK